MVLVDAGKRFYTFALAAVVASLLLGCGGGGGGATGEDGGGGGDGNTATRESIFFVDPDGGVYPVNETLISVVDGTTEEDVEALAALIAGEVFASFPETNSYFLRFPSLTLADLNTARLILEADSRVLFTTTNNVSTLTSRPPGDLDQFRQSQSSQPPTPTVAYELVKVFEAWDLIWEQNPPLSPVSVGIIDSGVDANHPEFRPVNITGFLEDLGGLKMNGDFTPSHGTEVAGIIGAANQLSLYPTTLYQYPQMNGILAGITDDFSLYSAQLGGATLVGGAKLNEIRESIRSTIQEGDPKIVNMSFGIFQCGAPSFFLPEEVNNPCRSVRNDEQFCVKEDEFPFWKREFEKIFNDHRDVLFVAGAGNCNIEAIWNLPGGAVEAPNLISVAATTTQDTVEWAWFSNGSKEQFLAVGEQNGIHIAAPGQNVYAPTIDKDAVPLELKDYRYFSGTSAAAPMVTGVAAMMKAINPELTPESIKAIITETASTPCNPKESSGCLLNAEAAVAVVLAAQRDLNLKVEDTVEVGIANASVLDVPNGTLLGVHDIGSQGVIVSGPVYAGGGWWWKVDFESGADGWVSDTYLNRDTLLERVVFVSQVDGAWDIFSVVLDGSDLVNLTETTANDRLPAVSPSLTKIAFVSDRDGQNDIYVMNIDGSDVKRLTNHSLDDAFPVWSPDGNRVAFISQRGSGGGTYDIYVMDSDGGNVVRLTDSPENDTQPHWSPDGEYIVFVSERDGVSDIFLMKADGSDQTNLTKTLATDTIPFFSPDGSQIAFVSDRDGDFDLWIMDIKGQNLVKLTSDGTDGVGWYSWSPDGKLIAFDSMASGVYDIYVVDPVAGIIRQVTDSTASDRFASWTWYGSKIAYLSDEGGTYTINVVDPDGQGIVRLFEGAVDEVFLPAASPVYEEGGGCFIATAAYGSYLEPRVGKLREFRDDYLLTTSWGKVFVTHYYMWSPPIADVIRQHESLRVITRAILTPIVFGVQYPIQSSLILFVVGFVLVKRSRRESSRMGKQEHLKAR